MFMGLHGAAIATEVVEAPVEQAVAIESDTSVIDSFVSETPSVAVDHFAGAIESQTKQRPTACRASCQRPTLPHWNSMSW